MTTPAETAEQRRARRRKRDRQRRQEQWLDECIGPRQVGGRYLVGDEEVTVLAIDRTEGRRPDGRTAMSYWMPWSITEATDEERARGASRTHCTAWRPDSRQYRVIRQPDDPPSPRAEPGGKHGAGGDGAAQGHPGAGLEVEVRGLNASISYAARLAGRAAEHGSVGGEGYLGHLTRSQLGGAALTTAHEMQAAFTTAAAAAERHAVALIRQRDVQQAYDQAPDTGDKGFLLDGR